MEAIFFSRLIDKTIEFGNIKNIDSKKYGEIINYAFFSLSIEYDCEKMTNNVKDIENKIFNFIDTIGLILSKE